MSNTIKINPPKGYTIQNISIHHSIQPREKLAIWLNLKALDEKNLLPKGYLTRVAKGQIKFETVKKRVLSICKQNAFSSYITVLPTDVDNNYLVISLQKTA